MDKKLTVSSFRKMKKAGEKIVMLTAYNAPMAALAEAAGVEMILVGDSLGMTELGYPNTIRVTMDQCIHHCCAVMRGAKHTFVVGDMPFMSYHADDAEALHNAARFMSEAGVDAVKLEGGAGVAPIVKKMVTAGVPVMGHIGLRPQNVLVEGGYRVAGKTDDGARQLLEDAQTLVEAGAFAIVLECVPAKVSKMITENIPVPTIGIGAGVDTDGQVQVMHDLIGLFGDFIPKHAKRYADAGTLISNAFKSYVTEVKEKKFPADENSF